MGPTRQRRFVYRSLMPAPAHDVMRWHEHPQALTRLIGSSPLVRVGERRGGVHDGGTVTVTIGIGRCRMMWVARHFGYIDGSQFCDEQVKGPFRVWRHTHRVLPLTERWCALVDRVDYVLPGGSLVNFLAGGIVHRILVRVFARRHQLTRAAVADNRSS